MSCDDVGGSGDANDGLQLYERDKLQGVSGLSYLKLELAHARRLPLSQTWLIFTRVSRFVYFARCFGVAHGGPPQDIHKHVNDPGYGALCIAQVSHVTSEMFPLRR